MEIDTRVLNNKQQQPNSTNSLFFSTNTQHQYVKPNYTQLILSQMSQAQATNTTNICEPAHTLINPTTATYD